MVQNKICKTLIALTILAQLGCVAKLKVTVDIFDTHALENSVPYLVTQIENLCESAQNRLLRTTTEALAQSFFSDYDQAVSYIRKNTDFNMAQSDVEGTKTTIREEISKTVSEARTQYELAVNNCTRKATALSTDEYKRSIYVMRQHIITGDKAVSVLKNLFCQSLAGLNSSTPCSIFTQTSTLDKEIKQILTKGLFGESIAGDQFASLITRAPEKYWNKYDTSVNMVASDNLHPYKTRELKARFNRATVNTFFGNADVAIKMNSPASFTVKGVRLDADEAIKSSFDVLQQGIKYLAYSNGIGVKDPATSAESKNTIAPLPEISENKQLKSEIDRNQVILTNQYNAFLNVIFSLTDQISSEDGNTRMQALRSIQNAHTVLRNTTDSLLTN